MKLIIVIFAILLSLPGHAQEKSVPGKRNHFALVIGNTEYSPKGDAPLGKKLPRLPNACNDARAVAAGFTRIWGEEKDIDLQCDLTVDQIAARIRVFVTRVQEDPLSIAVFYFAGHGLQVDQRQFIFGIDAEPNIEIAKKQIDKNPDSQLFVASSIDVYADFIQKVGAITNGGFTVIIDACRSDPLIKALNGDGVRRVTAPTVKTNLLPGILLALSTQNGEPALDGLGAVGPYADALGKLLVGDRHIASIFADIKKRVWETTKALYPTRPQIPSSSDMTAYPCFSNCKLADSIEPAPQRVEVSTRSPKVFVSTSQMHDFTQGKVKAEIPQTIAQLIPVPSPEIGRGVDGDLSRPINITLFSNLNQEEFRQSTGLRVEIFWCDSGLNSEIRKEKARTYGDLLVEEARRSGVITSVRLRSLTAAANSLPGYRYLDNYIVADSSDIRENSLSEKLISLSNNPPLVPLNSRNTPNYVSLFFCKLQANEDARRIYWQIPTGEVRPLAGWLMGQLDEKEGNFTSVKGIEVVAASPTDTEVRYFFAEDAAVAFKLADSLQVLLKHSIAAKFIPQLAPRARTGTVEAWIGINELSVPLSERTPPSEAQVPSRNRVVKPKPVSLFPHATPRPL